MALPGELKGGTTYHCAEVGLEDWEQHDSHDIPLAVHVSGGGYYIGYVCDHLGPISRESGYYPTREAAQADLDQQAHSRDTEFHPGPLEVFEVSDD